MGAAVPGDAQRLLRWSDWSWVTHVAKIYFRGGGPFTLLKEPFIARFQDAQIIRNRVAHSSTKARRQFKQRANSLLGAASTEALPRGFSPGEFLALIPAANQFPKFDIFPGDDHTWGDFFESFVSLYFEATAILCPTDH